MENTCVARNDTEYNDDSFRDINSDNETQSKDLVAAANMENYK